MNFATLGSARLSTALVAIVTCHAASGGGGSAAGSTIGSAPALIRTNALSAVAAPAETPASAATANPASTPAPAGDAASPTASLGWAAQLSNLSFADPDSSRLPQGLGPVPGCKEGYTPPASLTRTTAAPLPASGGVFYTRAELAVWQARVASGPFVKPNDYMPGSPGDWARISANARLLVTQGEATISVDSPAADRGSHGTLARDAALYQLVTGDPTMRAAVRRYLLAQVANPANDFASTLCTIAADGWVPDARYHQASWFLRFVVTYDYMRSTLDAVDRLMIENAIVRNAYFMAVPSDRVLARNFPRRQMGSYAARGVAAAPKNDDVKYWSKRYDTDGDCKITAADDPRLLPTHAYARADGTPGPRITVLSQYYNNRRSIAATAYGAAGVLLADSALIASAKRYFMEWLAYSVWPDGSQGEFARNGDYCIPSQGMIYGSYNVVGAGYMARILARQGDQTLLQYATTDGLFGTETPAGGTPKTLELAVSTYLKLLNGQLQWFFHEPWRTVQRTDAANSAGLAEVHYMASPKAMDDYHELGLLTLAGLLPGQPISAVVMRDKSVTALRFPGSTGKPVATGYGGAWTDNFNALPAALLLRP